MSKADEIKLKDLPVRSRIVNKHKEVSTALWVITYIIFFPIVILQIINDGLEIIIDKSANLRSKLVYTIFKAIYKKEIIANEMEIEKLR